MSAHAHPRLTPEQYLEIERAAESKSDYYDGYMYAMSGGSLRHAVVSGSLIRALGNALMKRPCTVATSDLRLRVGSGRLYTYPDAIVFCGEAKLADDHNDILLNPTIIAEVLSPSTERYDRGIKFAHGCVLPGVGLPEKAAAARRPPRQVSTDPDAQAVRMP